MLRKANLFYPSSLATLERDYCKKSLEDCSKEDLKKNLGYENCLAYKDLI
ncbi:MAG: hypothetical protein AABX88_00150 [Nanoarchaeota archaeon]